MWTTAKTVDGKTYYYHSTTRETRWTNPGEDDTETSLTSFTENMNNGNKASEESQHGYWIIQNVASSGMEEGETYYLNTVTGETSWEKPDGYDEQTKIYRGLSLDADCSALDVVDVLELTGSEATNSRDRLVSIDVTKTVEITKNGHVEDSLLRLSTFLHALETVGTEMEWEKITNDNNTEVIHLIYKYWCNTNLIDINLYVAKILLLSGKLHSKIYIHLTDGTWGTFSKVVEYSYTSMKTLVKKSVNDNDIKVWLCLMESCLALDCYEERTPRFEDSLPKLDFIKFLFEIMSKSSEEVCDYCTRLITLLHKHYKLTNNTENDITTKSLIHQLCLDKPDLTSPLSTSLLRNLNNRTCLWNAIAYCQDIFENPDTAHFFYSTDLMVLIDIIIRECESLPMTDIIRAEFLRALKYLLMNSQWFESGRYEMEKILSVLEGIMNDPTGTICDESLVQCQEILFECASLLE